MTGRYAGSLSELDSATGRRRWTTPNAVAVRPTHAGATGWSAEAWVQGDTTRFARRTCVVWVGRCLRAR